MKSPERRHRPRKALERLAYIHIEPDNGGIILNVSGEGLCFQSVAPVDQGRPLLFSLFERNRSIAGAGRLVWTDETHKLGGLRFTALNYEARNQIREWMNQRTATPEANAVRGVTAREYEPPLAVLAGDEMVTGANEAARDVLPGREERPTAPVTLENRAAAASPASSASATVPFPVPAGNSSTLEIAFRQVDYPDDRSADVDANHLATVVAPASRERFSARKLAIAFTTAALLGLGLAMLFTRNPRDPRPVRALVRPLQPVAPLPEAPPPPAQSAPPASSPRELEAPAVAPPKPVVPAEDQRPLPTIAVRKPAEKRAKTIAAIAPLPPTTDPGPTERVAISGAPQSITYPSSPGPGLAGKVRLKLVIGPDGSVTGVTVVAGNPILANAAVRAVRHWRYPPTEAGGRAVEAETTVTISFLGPDVVTINFRP